MRRRWALRTLVLGLVLVVLTMWRLRQLSDVLSDSSPTATERSTSARDERGAIAPRPETRPDGTTATSTSAGTRTATASRTPADAKPVEHTRSVLPRPEPGAAIVAPRTKSARKPVKLADHLPGELKDRRGGDAPNAKAELEALRYGLDTVEDDVRACLEQWSDALPDHAQTITIGFRLAAEGLTEAFVVDAGELAFGPKTCFANAVYGVDWSNIVTKPGEVTQRFELVADEK